MFSAMIRLVGLPPYGVEDDNVQHAIRLMSGAEERGSEDDNGRFEHWSDLPPGVQDAVLSHLTCDSLQVRPSRMPYQPLLYDMLW